MRTRFLVLLALSAIIPSCGGGGGGAPIGPSVGNIQIVSGAGKAELSWSPLAGATNYLIKYSSSPIASKASPYSRKVIAFAPAAPVGSVATVGRVSAVLNNLPPGTAYYSVEAVFGGGGGAPSETNVALFDPTFLTDGAGSLDFFGWTVASAGDVNGDGFDDFVVGAPSASPGGRMDAGSVFVYSGADGSLLYQKDGTTAGDAFGTSVFTAGDVNGDGKADFIVGAPFTGANTGTAYVYSGANGSILYTKTGETETVEFGYAVSTAGDVNGDGKADFIVGSFKAYPGGSIDAGSAFVYSGADGTLLYRKNGQNASGATSADKFGISVATAGDVNGDGKSDFIVGAFGVDSGGSLNNVGAIYVYSGTDGSLLYTIVGEDGPDALFGNSVATAGDVDGDGLSDFMVGAPHGSAAGLSENGVVHVYSGASGALLHTITGPVNSGNFGYSVSTAGDVNGDGYSDFIIGGGNLTNGRATVYSGRDGSILYMKEGTSPSGFGTTVCTTGDSNGDGLTDFVVGAPGASANTGSAFVFLTAQEVGIIPSETQDPFAARPFIPIRTPKVSPTASKTFAASGGTAPYTWNLLTNNSGSTGITSLGVYTSGSTLNVFDTIRVTDSLGRSHDTRILVTDGVSAAPPVVNRPLTLGATLTTTTQIDLSWNDAASNETGFRIEYRKATESWALHSTIGPNLTSASISGLDPSTVYLFRVKAFNTTADSLWSPEAIGTLPAPSGLVATPTSMTQITLTWTDNSTAETGFRVQYRTNSGEWISAGELGPDTTQLSATGLIANTQYTFRAQSFSGTLDSAWTADVVANTLP